MTDAPLNKVKMLVSSTSDSEGNRFYETFSSPVGVILFNSEAKKTCKFRINDEGHLTDIMYYNSKEEWQIGKP